MLEGEGVFILDDDKMPIRKGGFIATPANPELRHQVVNTSNNDLIYLCVSTMLEPEIAYYPDFNKIGVLAGNPPGKTKNEGFSKFSPVDSDVNYWDSEG